MALADRGVCCVDELDKMTADHQARCNTGVQDPACALWQRSPLHRLSAVESHQRSRRCTSEEPTLEQIQHRVPMLVLLSSCLCTSSDWTCSHPCRHCYRCCCQRWSRARYWSPRPASWVLCRRAHRCWLQPTRSVATTTGPRHCKCGGVASCKRSHRQQRHCLPGHPCFCLSWLPSYTSIHAEANSFEHQQTLQCCSNTPCHSALRKVPGADRCLACPHSDRKVIHA